MRRGSNRCTKKSLDSRTARTTTWLNNCAAQRSSRRATVSSSARTRQRCTSWRKPLSKTASSAPTDETKPVEKEPARKRVRTKQPGGNATEPRPTDRSSGTLEDKLKRLHRAAAKGKPAAKLLPFALQLLSDECGFDIASFLIRDRATGDLRLRVHRGKTLPAAYFERAIRLDESPLLQKLLDRERGFAWLPDKHADLLDVVPRKLLGRHRGLPVWRPP